MAHYQTNSKYELINACPNVWKWNETFPNYFVRLELVMNTAITVEIVTRFSIDVCAHRFNANLTLNSMLLFCTAKSINATVSSFSAAAVSSTRTSQRLSFMCISAEVHERVSLASISLWTHSLIAHISRYHQGDQDSDLEILSPLLDLRSYLGIYPGNLTRQFSHCVGTGHIS